MRKFVLVVGGLVAAGVLYWLVSPLFIERRVNEKIEDITPSAETIESKVIEQITLRQGNFVGLAGHSAEGTARLLKVGDQFYVRFEEDFRVTNGPDLFVYFGKDGTYYPETRLSGLKGNVGSQQYTVPANINPDDYNEVWVWCRAFSVPFGKAKLES